MCCVDDWQFANIESEFDRFIEEDDIKTAIEGLRVMVEGARELWTAVWGSTLNWTPLVDAYVKGRFKREARSSDEKIAPSTPDTTQSNARRREVRASMSKEERDAMNAERRRRDKIRRDEKLAPSTPDTTRRNARRREVRASMSKEERDAMNAERRRRDKSKKSTIHVRYNPT